MCDDELPGRLARPEDYATFAIQCRERGYTAFKPHTWMPPSAWAPDPRKDVAACRAVAEVVGADMRRMLASFRFYSREEALLIGRELEQLGFYWLEEPIDEHSMSA
jgi:L-alanine-DL-glutamate epimerase-like enolase superfamily enzyme